MIKSSGFCLPCVAAILFLSSPLQGGVRLLVEDTGERAVDPGTVEICGVAAGPFSADDWTTGPPYQLADVRHPLLEPRQGKWRNIYAPSAVAMADGTHTIYYGAWDGIANGNDHIYVTTTSSFLDFGPRNTVVAPGSFQHVCNVNAEPDIADPTQMNLMCTLYPDQGGLNKPAMFKVKTGVDGVATTATLANFVMIDGYPDYARADINGMNVMVRDGNRRLLYFGDFHNFTGVQVAEQDSSSTTTDFRYIGQAMAGSFAVNDVKILHDLADPEEKPWYLMGLHMNRGKVYYSLSRDPLHFPPPNDLAGSLDQKDKHMVAIGFVTDKAFGATRVLGFLYGAGSAPSLDANRIFARWFQKQLTVEPGGAQPAIEGARGPDRVVLRLPEQQWTGRVNVATGTDGRASCNITLLKSHVYRLTWMRD